MVWYAPLDGDGKFSCCFCISLFNIYCLQGREIQTNCFLASYNNRNHSHL